MPKSEKQTRKRWTKEEIELLRKYYGTMTREELRDKYLPNRTIPTIAQKARELKLTRQTPPWTDAENTKLMQGWTEFPKDRILKSLPGRTWTQCRNQVNKLKTEGKWTPTERRNYADIEPAEHKRRSDLYNMSLKEKMGLTGGTSVLSFKNNKLAKNNKTGVRGVSKTKSGKFTAYIRFQGKLKYLGVFDSLEDAKMARENAFSDLLDQINMAATAIGVVVKDQSENAELLTKR